MAEEACADAQGAEYMGEARADFTYTEDYCVICARLWASYAVVDAVTLGLMKTRSNYLPSYQSSHSWAGAARALMARACVYEYLRGPEKDTIYYLAGLVSVSAREGERRAQADLLRKIIVLTPR